MAAISTTVAIAVLMIISLFFGNATEIIENIILCITYMLLPAVYVWTLRNLRNAMKGLLSDEIDTERHSVLMQFSFFLVSYLTRLPFDFTMIFFLNDLGGQNFAF